MHLLLMFLACFGLALLFPKGFKYMVGTWLGFAAGWVLCCLALLGAWSLGLHLDIHIMLATLCAFLCVGVLGGCVVAAKG